MLNPMNLNDFDRMEKRLESAKELNKKVKDIICSYEQLKKEPLKKPTVR